MKRAIVASILAFVLLFALGLVAYGEMAKEGTLSGTVTYVCKGGLPAKFQYAKWSRLLLTVSQHLFYFFNTAP
jgi:hypothetical protein